MGVRNIFDAIDGGDLQKLRSLVNPTEINRYNREMTALFYAVYKNCPLKIIELLCKVDGIDLNKGNESGSTPLSEGVRLKRVDVIKFLCQDNRVNVQHKDWESAERQNEMFASDTFNPLLARLARDGFNKFDTNKVNGRGDSLLHMAVMAEQAETIKYLCEHVKLDFKANNLNGFSAFDLIFPQGTHFDHHNCDDICKSAILVACKTGGKDVVSRKDSKGRTVLHLAVLEGDKEAVKMICTSNKTDIDINVADDMGKAPLSLAIDNSEDDIALFLLSLSGVRIDVTDQLGKGIFHVLKDIVIRKQCNNNELSFILENYLTEEAVPEKKSSIDNLPYVLEKLFETADDETSILSELCSQIEESIIECDLKTICTALHNVIIIGLQKYGNHKRLQYVFHKGSVFRTFVQIFVGLDVELSNESDYLVQVLKILYISAQANIRCDCAESGELSDTKRSENRNKPANIDTIVSDIPSKSQECNRSLKQTLGTELVEQFRRRIEGISKTENQNTFEVSDSQLIAKGINKAYFKDNYGCCGSVKQFAAKASNWLSSLFRLNKVFHKCICRGDFAFISCFLAIFVHASDVYSDARFGFKTLAFFSERLGVTMILLVFGTLIHENVRSVVSTYATDKELLRITLGKIDLSPEDLKINSKLNYFDGNPMIIQRFGQFFWTFKVYQESKNCKNKSVSKKALLFNILSIFMLRPIVDRLIVLTHSPSHLRAIYRQQSKQKSLNQYYMILEQIPELLIQFYVFQIYFNILRTDEDYNNYGCTEHHSFAYKSKKEYFECVENLWLLKICASWWEIYSMLVPFVTIPKRMVSLEEMIRKLSPETPKMSAAASVCLYIAYILMIPSRLFLFAAVMHSATNHLYVVAYLGAVTCVWLAINMYTLMGQKKVPKEEKISADKRKGKRTAKYYFKTIWSLLLFTIRDVVVISLRQADAYFLSPSEVNYKTLRTWRRMLAISSCYFVEGVVGAVYVEHYYPCGRNTEIFKYQGWLYLITLIVSVTIITLLSYILQPTKIYIIPHRFSTKAALICSLGLLMWFVCALTFLLTTKNSPADVRLPLIITTLVILFVFLVVVVVLRYSSEAKHPKEKNIQQEDHATNSTSLQERSCCLLKLNCCLSNSAQHNSIVDDEQSCSPYQASNHESNNKNSPEHTAPQKFRFPGFLKRRNNYEEMPSKEGNMELRTTGITFETV